MPTTRAGTSGIRGTPAQNEHSAPKLWMYFAQRYYNLSHPCYTSSLGLTLALTCIDAFYTYKALQVRASHAL